MAKLSGITRHYSSYNPRAPLMGVLWCGECRTYEEVRQAAAPPVIDIRQG